MIIGYMVVGVVCGKYVTGMLKPETLDTNDPYSVASIVTSMTLAFISLSAGCELHIPSLGKQKLCQIGAQIASMAALTLCGGMLVFAAVVSYGTGIVPATLLAESVGCRWSVAWMLAVIQLAGSVIEVLAIFHETKASGPVSQLMIGTTMLLDMAVVVLFAIAQTVVVAACPARGIEASATSAVIGIVGQLVFCLVGAGIYAGIVRVYMMVPSGSTAGATTTKALVLATGWACYFGLLGLNESIPLWAPTALKMLRVDPLLVCMLGSSFLQHFSSCGGKLRELVHSAAPLIMPPFFTVVGATLNLSSLKIYAVAVLIFFVTRFVALGSGSLLASLASRHTTKVRRHLWMTLQSQSGVTLALVLQMTQGMVGQHAWSKDLGVIITGCVALNQLVGPAMCRWGIQLAGESHDSKVCDSNRACHDHEGSKMSTRSRHRQETPGPEPAWDVEFQATLHNLSFVMPNVEDQMRDSSGEEQPSTQAVP
jgi:hypothetical protein